MKVRTKITIGMLIVIAMLVSYTIISGYEKTEVILRLLELAGVVAINHQVNKSAVDIKVAKYDKKD